MSDLNSPDKKLSGKKSKSIQQSETDELVFLDDDFDESEIKAGEETDDLNFMDEDSEPEPEVKTKAETDEMDFLDNDSEADDADFLDDTSEEEVSQDECPWNILIVDDEEGVHDVTTFALKRFTFDDRPLKFLHAYSSIEAKKILQKHSNIALILLDVVMETEHAGLDLVKIIRRGLKNESSRIVLRTGQAGKAPEYKVIRDYDINDYKTKTELTANKLSTLVYSTLRAYRDIITLQKSKLGLEKLIVVSRMITSKGSLNSFGELNNFIQVTMKQLGNILNLDGTTLFSCETSAFELGDTDASLTKYSPDSGTNEIKKTEILKISDSKQEIINEAISKRCNIFQKNQLVMYCSSQGHTILFFARINHSLSELDINLLNIFTENLVVILENILLNELVTDSQKEMVYRLGEVVESRSNETGFHVKRVAYYSELLARLLGLPEEEIEFIKTASPMHDIGKISIPDAILTKPAKLTAEEWALMQTHSQRGYDILAGSHLKILDISAIIALTHHEKWDGSGYPNGIKGTDIHLYGRIAAIADVFDALGSDRVYKKKWPLEKILKLLQEESGKHFDPDLVKLFLENIDEFTAIRDRYTDV